MVDSVLGGIRTYVAYLDSSWHCLVDRAFGNTKWIPHRTVLADW